MNVLCPGQWSVLNLRRTPVPTFIPLLTFAAISAMPMQNPDPVTTQGPPTQEMARVLDQLKAYKNPPLPSLPVPQARQLPNASYAVMEVLARDNKPATDPTIAVTHTTVPGPGGPLVVRIYRPKDAGNQILPVAVYFRGGGWTIADLNTYDASCRAISKMANCMVASVSYRSGPENKFPAAHEDSYAAYQYLSRNAGTLRGDAARMAVIGESAGGNLANAVSMMARDRGGAVPKGQVLVYPVTQLGAITESYRQNQNSAPLDVPTLMWMGKNYTKSPADFQSKYLSPLSRATDADLRRLPPTTIILAEIDPLRTEGFQYAARLKGLGVTTATHFYKGMTHEFFGMGAVLKEGMEAEEVAADALKVAFGS